MFIILSDVVNQFSSFSWFIRMSTLIFIILFNAGIALRAAMKLMQAMADSDDEINILKFLKKYIIVIIIVNCISALAFTIEYNYYK